MYRRPAPSVRIRDVPTSLPSVLPLLHHILAILIPFDAQPRAARRPPLPIARQLPRAPWVLIFFLLVTFGLWPSSMAQAAASLTDTALSWNTVGLDSNNVAVGPNNFPVGARICNTGGSAATNVASTFVWDDGLDLYTGNAYINLRSSPSNSLSAITTASLAAGACVDHYYEVTITRDAGAYNHTRAYHINATATGLGTFSTPSPRQLFVEHLISQNRNGISDFKVNGVSVPSGGTSTLMVGNTYTIELDGSTATQGYNQIESFINFPNTIFQVLGVSTSYSADNSPYVPNPNDKLYADSCLWDNDPGSPTYASCVGGDYKAGGTLAVTYTIKVVAGAGTTGTLNSLIYDFSGSSFHYNADYAAAARILSIVSASVATIQKSFAPKAISPGGTSVLSFRLTNPTTLTFTGVKFDDSLPSGLVVASTPTVTTSGCGAGAFSPTLSGGETSISFANATLAANSICTISLKVTAASAGTYNNTSGHLFINTSTDTGNTSSDTLKAASAPACTPNQTLATWTVPNGTTANPPDLTGGRPTTQASRVSTAAASAHVPASTQISTSLGQGDTTSWSTYGYKTAGQYIQFVVDTSKYSGVNMSFYVANQSPSNGPTSLVLAYDNGGGFVNILTINNLAATFTLQTQDFTGLTNTGGNTTFRLTATGANNDNTGAGLNFDNITFKGCSLPVPAPTLSKSFAPDSIAQGATSTLSFTLNNTATGNQALTGVTFSDVLPAGLSVTDASVSKCGGTLTTTASTRTIALTGGSISAGGSCSFSVTVTGTTAGAYVNTSGFVSSTESGTSTNYATSALTVVAPPVLAKSFSPNAVFTGNTSTLSFSVTNPNISSSLSGVGFTDILPAGLSVVDSSTSKCGGTLTVTSATRTISLSVGSLAANGSCTFTVTVTGATAGTRNNTTNAVTSTEGGNGNTASATLVVNNQTASLDLTKQVAPADAEPWTSFVGVAAGSNVYYRFKVYNSGDLAFTALSITDPTLAGSPLDPATCNWTASLPLAPGGTAFCTKGPISAAAGSHQNTATAQGTYASGSANSLPSTARYATTGLALQKSAQETDFSSAGAVLHYSYLVSNSGAAPLSGPVSVADDKTTVSCPALTGIGNLNDYLDPGESITCTATYDITAADMTNGSVTNHASAASAASPSAGAVNSNADTVTVPEANPTAVEVLYLSALLMPSGQVDLSWQTAVESNIAAFRVMRSSLATDGFVSLGTVPAKTPGEVTGNSYEFSDRTLPSGEPYFYKLKIVHLDGSVSETQVLRATAGPSRSGQMVWP